MAWDDGVDYKETGSNLYHEGIRAHIHDEPFDEVKPKPWRLGWQDQNELHLSLNTVLGENVAHD